MSKVLIGSVYSDSPRSLTWYKLQIEWLNKTTDFEHVVYPNCDLNFNSSIVLPRGFQQGQLAHIEGLNSLVNFFKTTDYENFLLLDSDCFPIRKWTEELLFSMKGYSVAAIVRQENLDTFAHPAAFFFTRDILDKIEFGLNLQYNMIGQKFYETSSNIKEFWPLIRTNKINYHHILYGVYWDTFYHHGAGSRDLKFRCYEQGYYNKESVNWNEQDIFQGLSEEFIKSLCHNRKGLFKVM